MGIILGSARIDENGNIAGGTAGDQTGSEVSTQSFYMHSQGWYCLRPKDVNVANKIATAMKQACDNNNIGYDQNQRNTVLTQFRNYGSLGAIKTKCEADCSSLVRTCVLQASGKDVGDFTTGSEASVLERSGLFESRFSVTGEGQLYNGDVLVTKTKGHTVVVVSGRARSGGSSGSGSTTTWKATGTATCTDDKVNVRSGAGTNYSSYGYLYKGNRFEIDGKKSGDWVHIKVAMNGGYVIGWIHSDYVKYDTNTTSSASSWKATGTATCTENNVNVRKTPNGTVIGRLGKGNRFEIDGQKSDVWVHVKVAGIGIGYIHQDYVKYDGSSSSSAKVESAKSKNASLAGTYQVTGTGKEGLSLRAGAGTNKTQIAVIPEGGKVQNYGYYTKDGGYNWLYVTYNGKTGFVCDGGFLKKM